MFNYGDFNNNVIMTNLSYEVALEIRQAQVYSLGVRGASNYAPGATRDAFNTRYGVYFNIGEEGGDTNFVSFADFYPVSSDPDDPDVPDGNGFCDGDKSGDDYGNKCSIQDCFVSDSGDNECLQVAKLARAITFTAICVSDEGVDPVDIDAGTCGDPDDVESVEEVHITFARPYTDSLVWTSSVNGDEYDKNVGIILESSGGAKRAVIVKSTGQVSVEFIKRADPQ